MINHEVFERAAERIQRKGMVKEGYYRGWLDADFEPLEVTGEKIREGDLKCCSIGAIAAELVDEEFFPITDYMDFFARAIGLGDNWALPEWNDRPSRRPAHLVKAFRKAAVAAGGEA